MKKIKKILDIVYLLVFCTYAISPIVASVPTGSSWVSVSDDSEEAFARLQIFDVLIGQSESKEAAIGEQGASSDLLLKKKRTVTSKKTLLEVIISTNLIAPERPQVHHLWPEHATLPAYYTSFQYFVSGVSPPSLS